MTKATPKRTYHPMVIVLYSSKMLSVEQLKQIPNSTKFDWNKFQNDNYYGYEWTNRYLEQFDNIKGVFESKFVYRTTRLHCKLNAYFKQILQAMPSSKKWMVQQAESIISNVVHLQNAYGITIKNACRILGISINWYYRQKSKMNCSVNPFNRCFRKHPQQLTFEEIKTIDGLIHDQKNKGKPLSTLYYLGLNKAFIFCSLSTFSKYAYQLGFKKRPKKPKNCKPGLKATRPFEWLHVDITLVPTEQGGMQKVAFVKDNFSKAVLHFKSTSQKADSHFIRALFEETFQLYNLFTHKQEINILSDGGSENKGALLDWIEGINAPPIVRKITAHTPECPFSNNMSESTHAIFKSEFMKGKQALNPDYLNQKLIEFQYYVNYERYPMSLLGFTTHEVLHGAIPDKYRFKELIQLAKKERIESNKKFNNCPILSCF